jgi:chromate reductase
MQRRQTTVDRMTLRSGEVMDQQPIRVLGISGSLRRSSYNTALLRVAAEEAAERVTLEVADISDFPLYNFDLEKEAGLPASVVRVRNQVNDADALVFASPEYNYSVTGALKNALDWLSRPPASPLDAMPAAIMGAGGRLGTARSQAHLRDILRHNRLHVVMAPEVLVPAPWERFDDELTLTDQRARDQIRRMMEELVRLVDRERLLAAQ